MVAVSLICCHLTLTSLVAAAVEELSLRVAVRAVADEARRIFRDGENHVCREVAVEHSYPVRMVVRRVGVFGWMSHRIGTVDLQF